MRIFKIITVLIFVGSMFSCSKDDMTKGHAKDDYKFVFNGKDTTGGFYVSNLHRKLFDKPVYSIQIGLGEYKSGFTYVSITHIPIQTGKFQLCNSIAPYSSYYSTRIYGGQSDVYNILMRLSDEKDSINYIEIQEMDVESKKFKGNYSAIYYDQSSDNDVIVKGAFESTLPE